MESRIYNGDSEDSALSTKDGSIKGIIRIKGSSI